jgi:nucleoside-diphosphate-sugar epimerase
MASRPRVCVTGAGGYIASWLVKLLLSRGYAVHATVREPDHPKNACLKQLDGASENLRLFKADVLDYCSLAAAFAGCQGVFHPASPVPDGDGKHVDPEQEMVAPIVKGTKNVLEACSATSVQKLVVVSTVAAVCLNPSWPQGKIKDESCWSSKELCRGMEIWYAVAKTEAEEMSLEYGEKKGLNVVTLLPGLVVGPVLQTERLNISIRLFQYVITGPDTMNNKFWAAVHVHDVADALLLVYETPESSGRYICSLEQMDIKDMVNLLKSRYPNYDYVDKTVDVDFGLSVSSEKLRNLGWKPRSLEETLVDGVQSLEKAGLLTEPCRLPYFYRMNAEE